MAQEHVWDREYRNPKFLTKENKPQSDTVRFVKFLKKNGVELENNKVIDLGSGTGRNSFYFAELGAEVVGLEISKTAINQAKKFSEMSKVAFDIRYLYQSIGEKLPFEDNHFDIAIDVTSSNSLDESEREIYIKETNRVLKPGGWFFVKALCKDGDNNAKNLLKHSPGQEYDTYIMKEVGLKERVWSKKDFENYYGKLFSIKFLEKKTSYSLINNRSYKRNFWICYMQKVCQIDYLL